MTKDFSKNTVFKLHEIVFIMDCYANKILQDKFQINYNEFLILKLLNTCPNFTQQNLANALRLGRSAISQRISKMQSKNLLNKKIKETSKRENQLTLSEQGRAKLEEASQMLIDYSEILFKKIKKYRNELDLSLDILLDSLKEKEK
jgi:DNA-binding MarR family transcriptional regulator